MPDISIVIPCFNQAHYLGDAIESVLAQTYRQFEIVVVDDGSPDDVARTASRYPGIRYIRQENRGLGAARNTGLAASHGDLLVFLDADDRLLPNALEAGKACLLADPDCAFAAGAYAYIGADGSPIGRPMRHRIDGDPYLALLRKNHIGMHATVMYRREVFAAVGPFDASLPACEDYELYLRIARTHRIRTHDTVVAEYRRHGAAMSRDSSRMLETALAVLHAQRPHLAADRERWRAYRTGIRFIAAKYGFHTSKRIAAAMARGEIRRAGKDMAVLVRSVWRVASRMTLEAVSCR